MTEQFLKELYGKLNTGCLSVTKTVNKVLKTKWFEPTQLTEMAAYIEECGKTCNVSIGINPRNPLPDKRKRGTAEDVCAVIGLYEDFDIYSEVHAEKRLPRTKEELISFIDTFPMKPSITVFSGNGLHLYWLFDTPFIIGNAQDRNGITQILDGWESYILNRAAEEHDWYFDPVADLARMLRAPGTLNHKTAAKPECTVLEMNDIRYTPDDFKEYKGSRRTSFCECDTDEEMLFALMGKGSGEELIEKCDFIRYCRDEAGTLSEPEWHAAITNLALTQDGHERCHEISEPYPAYSYKETEQKFITAAKNDSPASCEYIHKKFGFKCSKDCRVKCPIGLVRENTEENVSTESKSHKWDEPLAFDDYDLPAFPVHALPEPIRTFALELAESMQVPVDLPANSIMGVMSAAVQRKYKVEAKPGWQEQVNLFILTVMPPSERKSAAANYATAPLTEHEASENKRLAPLIEANKMKHELLERRRKATEDGILKGKSTMDDLNRVAEELANFKELKPLRLFYDDITSEKVASVLAENNGQAAIISTEGGIFDIMNGQYSKNINIDVYLKGYSGDPIRIDRINRRAEYVNDPALTMNLMCQPTVLQGMMSNPNFRGRGLNARFLYSIPKSFVGSRKYRTAPVSREAFDNYRRQIINMLQDEYPETPEVIGLSSVADMMLEKFANELEPKLISDYLEISDWAGKLIGNTVRIAGLLCRASTFIAHDFEEPFLEDEPEDTNPKFVITGEIMANAIEIARYYLAHAVAAYAMMGADNTLKESKYVIGAIRKAKLKEFTTRDLMRLCRRFKKVSDIQPVIDSLMDYGYIAPKEMPIVRGKGRPPAAAYVVNPCIFESA